MIYCKYCGGEQFGLLHFCDPKQRKEYTAGKKEGVLTEELLNKYVEDVRKAAGSTDFPLNTLPDGNIKLPPPKQRNKSK